SDGKPGLLVRSKQAGFDGLRLRVRVDAPQLPAPAAAAAPAEKKGKGKDGEAAAEAAAPADGAGGGTFNITIEREKTSGGRAVQEALTDVSLADVERENGTKTVGVAFKDNRGPKFVDIVVPDGNNVPAAKLTPREQQQALNIENRLIAAP